MRHARSYRVKELDHTSERSIDLGVVHQRCLQSENAGLIVLVHQGLHLLGPGGHLLDQKLDIGGQTAVAEVLIKLERSVDAALLLRHQISVQRDRYAENRRERDKKGQYRRGNFGGMLAINVYHNTPAGF